MKVQLAHPAKLLITTMLWLLASCVSVKIPTSEFKKSTNVRHGKISTKFLRFYPDHVDAAWRNQENGNSISYYSECGEDSQTSFANIQKGLLRSINDAKVEREMNVRVSKETGLRSIVSGQVDGTTSLIDLIIFSKDQCIFILTYVGTKEHFLSNQKDFENFYKGFEVNE